MAGGSFQLDAEGFCIQSLDPDIAKGYFAFGCGFAVFDGVKEIGANRRKGGVDDFFPGEFEIVGCDGVAVCPEGVAEVKYIDHLIGRDVYLLGDGGLGRAVWKASVQPFVDEADEGRRNEIPAFARIDSQWVGVECDAKRVG